MSRGPLSYLDERNNEIFKMYDESVQEMANLHGETIVCRLPRRDIIEYMLENKNFSRIFMDKRNIEGILSKRYVNNKGRK